MSCFHPIKAYRAPSGIVVFDVNKSATKVPFGLPCGKCHGCIADRSKQWAIRCVHEAKQWKENSFVTLTYVDEFLPPGGSLSLRDVQLFMKRLRKARRSNASNPIRFFLAGEYGDTNKRPHYHALLFNCGFPDRKEIGRSVGGEPIYSSDELSRLWSVDGRSMGYCSIGSVTFASAYYTAKYALKKADANAQDYTVFDTDGVCWERRREFSVKSLKPGIGEKYYARFGQEVRDLDNVVIEGREVRPPRYYDVLTERVTGENHPLGCHCVLCVNKRKRKRLAVLNRADNTPERLRVKEQIAIIAAQKKERKL